MDVVHLIVLAVVQGVTEFLPVSSSGHLVLVPLFMDVPDQGLILDVSVHVGTLLAGIIYFWRDVSGIVTGVGRQLRGRKDPGGRLLGLLIVGTIPVIAAGFAFNHFYPNGLRSLEIIGWTTLGFGVLLLITDRFGMTLRRIEHLRVGDAVFIGLLQILALIPGASRSGICITAARIMGMERRDAARFAMLLGIPAIAGAGTLKGYELWQKGDAQLTADALIAGGLSMVTALIAITLMMAWLRRSTFTIFAVYRFVLGGSLLAVAYGFA
mgnify:CR=1 FL=1